MDEKVVELEMKLEKKLSEMHAMEATIRELIKLCTPKSKADAFLIGTAPGVLIMNWIACLTWSVIVTLFVYTCSKIKGLVWDWDYGNNHNISNTTTPNPNDSDNHTVLSVLSGCCIRAEGAKLRRKLTECSRRMKEWAKNHGSPATQQLPITHISNPDVTTVHSCNSPQNIIEDLNLHDSPTNRGTTSDISDRHLTDLDVPLVIYSHQNDLSIVKKLQCDDIRIQGTLRVESGSTVVSLRLITAPNGPSLQEQCHQIATRVTNLDINATVQQGVFAIMYKEDEEIKTCELKELVVPIITSVIKIPGRALVVMGCNLIGVELKASTTNQCIPLVVFKQMQHKDLKLEVVFAQIPTKLGSIDVEGMVVYAYKRTKIDGGPFIVLRSEGESIKLLAPSVLEKLTAIPLKGRILILILNIFQLCYLLSRHSLVLCVGVHATVSIMSYCLVTLALGPWIWKKFLEWFAKSNYWRADTTDAIDLHSNPQSNNKTRDNNTQRRERRPNVGMLLRLRSESSDSEAVDDETNEVPVTDPNWSWPCFEKYWDMGRLLTRKVKATTDQHGTECPFEVVTYPRDQSIPETVHVRLCSPELVEIVRQSQPNADVPLQELVDAKKIFFCREGLYKWASSSDHDDSVGGDGGQHEQQAGKTRWYVRHLLRFMEDQFKETIIQYPRMKNEGRVSYDMLWSFLGPGVEVCYRCLITEQQCYGKVRRLGRYNKDKDTGTAKDFRVQVAVMDYNVERYYDCAIELAVGAFDGEVSFSSLHVCPMSFFPAQERQALEDNFVAMGKRFYEAAMSEPFRYMQFKGSLNFLESAGSCVVLRKFNADGRVMIDLLSFAKMNPDYPRLGNATPPCAILTGSKPPNCLKLLPEDKQLMLAPAIVYGFSFRLKKWGCFFVCGLEEISFDEEAFEMLRMRSLNQKQLLRGLVEQYVVPGTGAGRNVDPISSKGKGCVVLCHGPPGTGKTLTAEAIAETLHCPLWSMSAFELGTKPNKLENRLASVLEIAHTWHAILLLDEADTYLERRDEAVDIKRNLMTGVFLRLLEYHSSVLFLTTNRVKCFDDAILSRITIAISYPALDDQQRTQIWQTLLSRAGFPSTINCQPLLHYKPLNGREIRNIIRLAQDWARANKFNLTIDHIRATLEIFVTGLSELPACN